jgi:hypothetical protein
MRTLVVIEVDHRYDIPHLANMIAGRAYTIAGVTSAESVQLDQIPVLTFDQLRGMGFTAAEIALGAQDVERSA